MNSLHFDLSPAGFLIDEKQTNLLESEFKNLLLQDQALPWNTEASSNCAVCYSFDLNESNFIKEMDIWLTPDKSPLKKEDFDKINQLYKENGYDYLNQKYKLNANFHIHSNQGTKFSFSTQSGFLYYAIYFSKTKTGLRCIKIINIDYAYDIFKLIEYKDSGSLELLLKCGVNPNSGVKNYLLNPLMYAVTQNNLPAAKLLLEYGADVNAVTIAGGTALRIAVLLQHTEMAGLLLEYGANVNSITDGKTNLLQALTAEKPDKELIRLLCFCGGKINIPVLVKDEFQKREISIKNVLVPVILEEDLEMMLFILRKI